jgi:hypothetical protein
MGYIPYAINISDFEGISCIMRIIDIMCILPIGAKGIWPWEMPTRSSSGTTNQSNNTNFLFNIIQIIHIICISYIICIIMGNP